MAGLKQQWFSENSLIITYYPNDVNYIFQERPAVRGTYFVPSPSGSL